MRDAGGPVMRRPDEGPDHPGKTGPSILALKTIPKDQSTPIGPSTDKNNRANDGSGTSHP